MLSQRHKSLHMYFCLEFFQIAMIIPYHYSVYSFFMNFLGRIFINIGPLLGFLFLSNLFLLIIKTLEINIILFQISIFLDIITEVEVSSHDDYVEVFVDLGNDIQLLYSGWFFLGKGAQVYGMNDCRVYSPIRVLELELTKCRWFGTWEMRWIKLQVIEIGCNLDQNNRAGFTWVWCIINRIIF